MAEGALKCYRPGKRKSALDESSPDVWHRGTHFRRSVALNVTQTSHVSFVIYDRASLRFVLSEVSHNFSG